MILEEPTDRAGLAALAVVAFIERAGESGVTLTEQERAELGKATLEAYASLDAHCELCWASLELGEQHHGAELVEDLTIDLLHLIDGMGRPEDFSDNVVRCMAREDLFVGLMLDTNDTIGLAACALAAVYAHAAPRFDFDPIDHLAAARSVFQQEAETARIQAVVRERREGHRP